MKNNFKIITYLLLSNYMLIAQNYLDPNKAISQYNFDNWTNREGLPTSGAISIKQGKNGYLWIGTFEGLVRFDGVNFKVYNKKNTPLFKSDAFVSFYEDNNCLWVASQNGLLAIKDQGWKLYTKKNGLPSHGVKSILRDSYNRLWVGTANGLSYFKEGQILVDNIPDQLKNITIYDIEEDSQKRLWVSTTERGILVYDLSLKKIVEIHKTLGKIVRDLFLDADGNVWASSEFGLYVFKKNGDKKIYYKKDGLADNTIRKVYQDKIKTLWVATDLGLSRLVKNRDKGYRFESLHGFAFTNITEDNEGNLWLTTYRDGIIRLKDGKFSSLSITEGLSGKVVHNLFLDGNDAVLIASDNGLDKFQNNIVTNYSYVFPSGNNIVRDVCRDSKGTLWLGTTKGIIKDNLNGKPKIFTTKHGISNDFIRVIYEDQKGVIWFGTSNGLNKYENSTFTSFGKKDGLSNESILSIFQDSKGNLWVGTKEGLNKYKSNKFQSFSVKDGLAGNVVLQFYEDKDSILWVGSNGGLTRIENDKLFSFTLKDGLKSNSVFQVVEDNRGFFWVTFGTGIYTLEKKILNEIYSGSKKKVNPILYDYSDGMKNSNCSANARILKHRNGTFWVPTFDGIAIIDPNKVAENNLPPKTIIEQIFADDSLNLTISGKVKLPAYMQRITFKYTGLSFTAPDKIKFKYKLEGFDKDWSFTNKREISYTNLPSKKLTFKVISMNSDGIWGNEISTVNVFRLPKFYETYAFYVFCLFLIAILLYVWHRWRIIQIKHYNKRLKKQVDEQLVEVHDKNLKLEQQNEEIKSQRDKIEEAFHNVEILREIGYKITSTLSVEKIIETIYEHLNSIMDATVFGIGIYNDVNNKIEYKGAIEKGHKLPDFDYDISNIHNSLSARCLKYKKSIFISHFSEEYLNYITHLPKIEEIPESLIYIPLMKDEKNIIGVLTIQSFEPGIYSNYHLNIVMNLAIYITIALENANAYNELNSALKEFKISQQKLIESEKMASLGVLTAGIAHEINNPVNFINAGARSINSNFGSIKKLLELYESLENTGKNISLKSIDEIQKFKINHHYNEVMSELQELIDGVLSGANRTSEIVKSLRTFSRLDENDIKAVEITENIESALIILKKEYKERIEIVKDYEKIPKIECFPAKLNQVFMNILANAIQAIKDKGKITIKIFMMSGSNRKKISKKDQMVGISIRDTGIGMNDEVKNKILEPFFTTKPIGKGTGLGLSISYGIIKDHKGQIEIKSQEGKGSEFVIKLPIKQG